MSEEVDEAMIAAWADGELDEVTRRRLERAADADPRLASRLAAHRGLRDRLSTHYAAIADQPVPDALAALLRQGSGATPIATARRRRWQGWATGGAIAASLLLGLAVGRLGAGGQGTLTVGDHNVMAAGPLERALDVQLASAQGDAPFRIGISFRRKDGGWCRTFESTAIAGVACRSGRAWQVEQVLPGSRTSSGYRQAASSDARIMAMVDDMIVGGPADAAQEARAKAAGWH